MLQEQIKQQNIIIDEQADTINKLINAVNKQDTEIVKLKADLTALNRQVADHSMLLNIRGVVNDRLREEVNRLQQYTRRYSVTIAGIEKKRGEKEDDLLKEVTKVLEDVNSAATIADVDKFHRNGPSKGPDQEVIVRFRSHSAKEKFYKARKNLGEDSEIKIRPSLSPNSKHLLNQARDAMKTILSEDLTGMNNPPHFVFANIHGELQVKFTKTTRRGMFVSFSSIKELYSAISDAQNIDADERLNADFHVFDHYEETGFQS